MSSRFKPTALLAAVALQLSLASTTPAAESADQLAIRRVMASTWDRPERRLEAGPIVVVGERAVAAWTQGDRGGRALLARDAGGRWNVILCGGDGLKQARALQSTGIPAAVARQLASDLRAAEATTEPRRRALFSTFDGMVRMDSPGTHRPHGSAPASPPRP
ncbi:copper uptake system-associated protein [Piscinibacter koreensis]|uniref:Copper uptake system-associated protein n=1 Tax=Piscinibacter koreensis TaxID=2742824 RepID=A0A7Y6NP74_9BURK|nr:copper uptake system-associated protein [Schlegelella koreensis]NUZ06803.1 copper uptake system-associated protein [Schlegelella koreensis]